MSVILVDLDDLAQVLDRHPVTDTLHHAQVVRDEDLREAKALPKIDEQIVAPSFDRHIEG